MIYEREIYSVIEVHFFKISFWLINLYFCRLEADNGVCVEGKLGKFEEIQRKINFLILIERKGAKYAQKDWNRF